MGYYVLHVKTFPKGKYDGSIKKKNVENQTGCEGIIYVKY